MPKCPPRRRVTRNLSRALARPPRPKLAKSKQAEPTVLDPSLVPKAWLRDPVLPTPDPVPPRTRPSSLWVAALLDGSAVRPPSKWLPRLPPSALAPLPPVRAPGFVAARHLIALDGELASAPPAWREAWFRRAEAQRCRESARTSADGLSLCPLVASGGADPLDILAPSPRFE